MEIEKVKKTVYLDEKLIKDIEEIAMEEERTFANMSGRLIREAVDKRLKKKK